MLLRKEITMFPKLSQKAWREINDRLLDLPETLFHISVPIRLYNDLFDLEKYPITVELLFNWLRENENLTYMGDLNTVQDFWFKAISKNIPVSFRYDGFTYPINSMLYDLRVYCNFMQVDMIQVIGEIHGWWEKGGHND